MFDEIKYEKDQIGEIKFETRFDSIRRETERV